MAGKSAFEQRLHEEQLAARRCVTALDKVDPAAARRVVAFLVEAYMPAEATEVEGEPHA